jgi:hypothetical protein
LLFSYQYRISYYFCQKLLARIAYICNKELPLCLFSLSFIQKLMVYLTGIVPPYALEVEFQWKEKSSESTWVNI